MTLCVKNGRDKMDKDELLDIAQSASLAAHFAVSAAEWAASDHKARFSGCRECVLESGRRVLSTLETLRDLRVL